MCVSKLTSIPFQFHYYSSTYPQGLWIKLVLDIHLMIFLGDAEVEQNRVLLANGPRVLWVSAQLLVKHSEKKTWPNPATSFSDLQNKVYLL